MSELTRVVFEYSDGTKKYIDQLELEDWMKFNSLVSSCAAIHGMNPPFDEIKWKKIGKELKY